MTIFFIWVIAFVLIAYFANKRWESGVSQGLDKMLPEVLKSHGDNRYLWVAALAVLGGLLQEYQQRAGTQPALRSAVSAAGFDFLMVGSFQVLGH